MEVSQVYQLTAQTKNNNAYTLFPHFEIHNRRNLHEKEEKEALIRKIEALSNKNKELVEKQDSLHNTIYDLRKLLEFVGKQSLEECSYLHAKNKTLEKEAKGLQKSIEISHSNSNHLQRCALYWREFME